jgi:competence protein ComEA
MFGKRLLALVTVMGLAAGPVLAQGTSTATPATPAPAAATTATTPPATKPAKTTAHAAKATQAGTTTNLNTASAAQLSALPGIGKSRSKVILNERGKGGNFADWDDFDKRMAGTSVNAGVKAKIKNLVTF